MWLNPNMIIWIRVMMSQWLRWEKQLAVHGPEDLYNVSAHSHSIDGRTHPEKMERSTYQQGVLFRKWCACFLSSLWGNLWQAWLTPSFWETVMSSSGASPSFPLILLIPCSHSSSWCLQIQGIFRPSLTLLFNNLISLCTFLFSSLQQSHILHTLLLTCLTFNSLFTLVQ